MLIHAGPPLHLTYCLNIHPGESWPEAFDAIRTHTLRVRDMLNCDGAFGLGLRLGCDSARQLGEPKTMAEFRDFLARENLYVFTINGFPYGQFHDAAVKENVYRPDWQSPQRRDYTIELADILAELLPEGVPGSISTVPCSYKAWINSPEQVATMASSLADVAKHLAEIKARTGGDICLALEPEPDCYIATVADVIEFFTGPLRDHGMARLKSCGLSESEAADCLRNHLGVCVDTAHCAVEFENPAESVRQLQRAGVRIGKVQLSAALRAEATKASLRRLGDFQDEVYLHQVKVCGGGDGAIQSFRDLPEALADEQLQPGSELRVHFHVPLFFDGTGPSGPAGSVSSTASLIDDDFCGLLQSGVTGNLEIETYTFDVLPEDIRSADVAESIAREYRWVLPRLGR